MLVCLCHGVSERDVTKAVRSGARTVEEVGRTCGAGTDCGTCVKDLKRCVSRAKKDELRLVTLVTLASGSTR